ncbi:malto-oligosyltrehalose trehalohydrolase [Desulforhopalus sp. IMCC35007]|uniref:malto-oligosyltrehalose trehalohydrolase n=1 Tax=Desulforhopalus sp. IMCC35007 TaxID=2569543 RepID=UPI00197AF071|nr:malto-oligosyltrehalose trehalohydrolase [Desulforhopalus sp. IMCC35007]
MVLTPQNSIENSFLMSFGAQVEPAGGVLFQLWAPGAERVDLFLLSETAAEETVSMPRLEDGWYRLYHGKARPGDRYQFRIDRKLFVPDPASRYQASDIHGPSVVCDPRTFCWRDQAWTGRPWQETVIYELHVGAFSLEGNFQGVTRRLDYLVELGVTAIELMPVAHFPGKYNWGYDGALLFAPCNCYGTPDDLKNLVSEAHQRGLMVFLDVVYNHFGPEGNYLHVYARDAFFTEEFHTPWGAAINYCGPQSRTVRDFFISNALYWLEEYHLDGLRFDAVHAIFDPSSPDILQEISQAVRHGPGRRRHIHLMLENDKNQAEYLTAENNGATPPFTAQWNDDLHHACHTLLTGEAEGYYIDYADKPLDHLGRCLTQGFAYQGEPSLYRQGLKRGDPSDHLPPAAFISFLQNHDQIGNRAFGERLSFLCDLWSLKLCTALVLLAPSPPLLFMGEEFLATTPFYYFCNFGPELADSVTKGRRKEFAAFSQFKSRQSREQIPDPNAEETFLDSRLAWNELDTEKHQAFLSFYRKILKIRHSEIVPHIKKTVGGSASYTIPAQGVLRACWQLADASQYTIAINFTEQHIARELPLRARMIYQLAKGNNCPSRDCLPAKSFCCYFSNERGHYADSLLI